MHILKIFKLGAVKSSQNVRSIVSGLLTYCGTITMSSYGGVYNYHETCLNKQHGIRRLGWVRFQFKEDEKTPFETLSFH